MIAIDTVISTFNDSRAVAHYARAARRIGLWRSEQLIIRKFFDRKGHLLELGCGAGRGTLGLWNEGYRRITAVDFAREQLEMAIDLAREHHAAGIHFRHADATALPWKRRRFTGVLFLFNGLMQIPGRENRRKALREAGRLTRPDGRLLFTTHDRDAPDERRHWKRQRRKWEKRTRDSRLLEFGDRWFSHEHGETFMHLPVKTEIHQDLEATGWRCIFVETRSKICRESRVVRDFSDECLFWVAERSTGSNDAVVY